jgi:hypothetical protein
MKEVGVKRLQIPAEEATVRKTGLPFYDAARLIGAAHLLFGTASVEVRDEGSRWVLRGPKLAQGRQRQQLLWVLRELLPEQREEKKQPGKKQAAYAKIEKWV